MLFRSDDPPPSTALRDPPSLVARLVAALPTLPFQVPLNDAYASASLGHSKRSISPRRRDWRDWRDSFKGYFALYAAGGSAAVLAVLAVLALVVYQERMKEYIMDTFFGPAPPAACLRDPSAAPSYVPWRQVPTDDLLVYHCIRATRPSQSPPLRLYQTLPSACRDAFFEHGHICDDGSTSTFDLAWTWVNGSDALLHDAMTAAEDEGGHENGVGLQAGQKLYRCVFFSSRHATHGRSLVGLANTTDP